MVTKCYRVNALAVIALYGTIHRSYATFVLGWLPMATGVSKNSSNKALSAWNHHGENIPLPDKNEKASLEYKNKENEIDILYGSDRGYAELTQGKAQRVTEIDSNSFILDDNFCALSKMVSQGIKAKLFYLDPPYGTGFDFQTRDMKHSYQDSMGQAEYLEFMRRRLVLMRECMDEDGSIYVHIGHQMLGHLKVVMDEVFGADKCRNIITRRKCSSKNFTKRQYSNINDFILFYTKGNDYIWNQPGVSPDQEWIEREYPKIDEYGRRYKLVPIHAPGVRNGATGTAWRDMMPPPGKHWQYVPDKLEQMNAEGDIYWSRNGNPRRKVYLTPDKQLALTDYWEQYRDAHHQSVKVTGYPTEKNLDMLKMIVSASSNSGDVVIDPFCGSGSLLHAAHDLGRKYIGIDASFMAAETTLKRLKYGTKAMGDYVSKKSDKMILMPLKSGKNKQQALRFFVEEDLLRTFPDELKRLGSL